MLGNTNASAAAKSLQSCPTLCDPIDSSPPGSAVPGILQARTLEWVAISLSNAWKWNVKVKLLSRARLLATPWTAAYQAPSSMDFPGKSTGVECHCLLHEVRQVNPNDLQSVPGKKLNSLRCCYLKGWCNTSRGLGNPLQYSCLENPMDCSSSVHGAAKSWTRLSD